MQHTIQDTSRAHIELEQETDGRWIAELPSVPGMMAYGRTPEQAADNLHTLIVQNGYLDAIQGQKTSPLIRIKPRPENRQS